jgi:hypothetical protein
MMFRIVKNEQFLLKYCQSKANSRQEILAHTSEEELKALVECIINSNKSIFKSRKLTKLSKDFTILLNFFKSKKLLKPDKLRTLFIKNNCILAIIVRATLTEAFNHSLAYISCA